MSVFEPGSALTVTFAIVGAAGLAMRLVGPRELRLPALVALLVGQVGTVAALSPHGVRTHALVVLIAGIVALLVGVGVGGWLDRRPALVLAALAATASVRVPVPVGGETNNLLLPLYAVVGLGLLGMLVRETRALRARRHAAVEVRARAASVDVERAASNATEHADHGPAHAAITHAPSAVEPAPRSRGWLPRADPSVPQARTVADIAAAVVVLIWCASLSYALDERTGTVHAGLFILPFATAYLLAADAIDRLAARGAEQVTRALLRAGAAFVAVLSAAALAGIWQWLTHSTWQNAKVRIANVFQPDFRTNSIFFDPNVYGRYLVAALLAIAAWALFSRAVTRRAAIVAAAVSALLLIALWHTYSQSSFLELATGAAVLGTFVLQARGRRIALALVVLAVLAAAPIAWKAGVFDDAGRIDVARTGAQLAAEDPATGLGIGSFSLGYSEIIELRGEQVPKLRESHLTPLTIAVEQGIYGLCAYVLFLLALAVGAVESRRASEDHPKAWVAARWGAAVAAGLVVHSMLYASWFEDPLTWLAMAALVARPDVAGALTWRPQRRTGDSPVPTPELLPAPSVDVTV